MKAARSTELESLVRDIQQRVEKAAGRHDYRNLQHILKRLDLGENANAIPADFGHTEFTMLVGVAQSPQDIWNLLTSMARVNTTSRYESDMEQAEGLERLFFNLYNNQLNRNGRILPREETIVVAPQRAFG